MANSIALVDGKVGNFVELPDGRRLGIKSQEVLTDSSRPDSGFYQRFYQLHVPRNADHYLEVTASRDDVMEVRLTTEFLPRDDDNRGLDEMLTVVYDGRHLPRANAGLGYLFIDGEPEGEFSWVRFYSAGQHEPGTKVVTIAQDPKGAKNYYGGVILDKDAVRITSGRRRLLAT